MKFGKYLEREVLPMFDDHLKEPMIKYKILKKCIRVMRCYGAEREIVRDETTGDKCRICYQPWALGPGMIASKCKHTFHPICVLKYFKAEDCHRGCPVCSISVENFMPEGYDGSILQFLATICQNISTVEKSHHIQLRELERKSSTTKQLMMISCCEKGEHYVQMQLQEEVKNLYRMLLQEYEMAQFYGLICYEGVRKIIKKFDKHTMLDMSNEFLLPIQGLDFYRNCCNPGTGAIETSRQDLIRHFRVWHQEPVTLPPCGASYAEPAAAAAAAASATEVDDDSAASSLRSGSPAVSWPAEWATEDSEESAREL